MCVFTVCMYHPAKPFHVVWLIFHIPFADCHATVYVCACMCVYHIYMYLCIYVWMHVYKSRICIPSLGCI